MRVPYTTTGGSLQMDATDPENEPISIEEGDWWTTPPSIHGYPRSSTISQQLAEAFQTNAEAATPVPEYLKYERNQKEWT